MDVSADNTAITGGSTDDEWYTGPLECVVYKGPRTLKRCPDLFPIVRSSACRVHVVNVRTWSTTMRAATPTLRW